MRTVTNLDDNYDCCDARVEAVSLRQLSYCSGKHTVKDHFATGATIADSVRSARAGSEVAEIVQAKKSC